jgi:beta-lactamase superfamily II metal-dependent hydrolase
VLENAAAYAFEGMIQFLGPAEDYYDELVSEQVLLRESARAAGGLLTATRTLGQRLLTHLPVEVPFSDGEGTSPRNNTSIITMLEVDGRRLLFTGDAGVPALERAWDHVEALALGTYAPTFAQIPHHGSRRNASSALLDRLYGATGQSQDADCIRERRGGKRR